MFFGVYHGINIMDILILERKSWHDYIWLSSGCSSDSRGFFLLSEVWAIKLGYLTIRINSKGEKKNKLNTK